MNFIELFLTAAALSMDAFAVAVCKGLAFKDFKLSRACIIGGYFGFFQAAMPLAGYFLGSVFAQKITSLDHWIAFVLLALIGGNMVRESYQTEACDNGNAASLAFKVMLPLAIATSIDALAVGVMFAFMSVNVYTAALTIGLTTFAISAAGVKLGSVFGSKYDKKAERAGGLILIALGVKILIEHLFF